jgi:hypothetical protein
MSFMDKGKRADLASRDLAVKPEMARLHAQFHLYSVIASESRGVMGWARGRIAARPVTIYDLSGLPLFYDFPVRRGRLFEGFVRATANKVLGDPAVSTHVSPLGWDMQVARGQLGKLLEKKYSEYSTRRIRLACYSYPKLALSAELISPTGDIRTVLMDVADFTEIPFEPREDLKELGQVPYSYLDKIPEERRREGPETWTKVDESVVELFERDKRLDPAHVYELPPGERLEVIQRVFVELELVKLYTERVLDFCCHSGACKDHECFCLHPQENSVHCARASAQMMLCYWRYCFSQHEIAQAYGAPDNQGTYPHQIVPGLESLTNNCFNATQHGVADWTGCEDEIKERRPFMSCTWTHARACAGTKKWNYWIYGTPQPRYLYIFDPWPPNVGAVYWENFNTASSDYSTDYGRYTLARRTTNHV